MNTQSDENAQKQRAIKRRLGVLLTFLPIFLIMSFKHFTAVKVNSNKLIDHKKYIFIAVDITGSNIYGPNISGIDRGIDKIVAKAAIGNEVRLVFYDRTANDVEFEIGSSKDSHKSLIHQILADARDNFEKKVEATVIKHQFRVEKKSEPDPLAIDTDNKVKLFDINKMPPGFWAAFLSDYNDNTPGIARHLLVLKEIEKYSQQIPSGSSVLIVIMSDLKSEEQENGELPQMKILAKLLKDIGIQNYTIFGKEIKGRSRMEDACNSVGANIHRLTYTDAIDWSSANTIKRHN